MNPEDSIRSQLECSSIAEGVPCGYITGTHKGAKFFMLSNVKGACLWDNLCQYVFIQYLLRRFLH